MNQSKNEDECNRRGTWPWKCERDMWSEVHH